MTYDPLRHWILDDDHQPVLVDLWTWARWYEKGDRRVALTQIAPGVDVSTVFLGIDHNFWGGPPLLFETMTFGGDGRQLEDDVGFDRYSTWEEAEDGHAAIVAELQAKYVHQ